MLMFQFFPDVNRNAGSGGLNDLADIRAAIIGITTGEGDVVLDLGRFGSLTFLDIVAPDTVVTEANLTDFFNFRIV
jgi:hypothetical protein